MVAEPRMCYNGKMAFSTIAPAFRQTCRWITIVSGVLSVVIVSYALVSVPSSLSARLLQTKHKQELPWLFIDQTEVEEGITIPADTHVAFHMPSTFEKIQREVLLGRQGNSVRYWGYCLPLGEDPDIVKRRTGFPGLLYLSEKEREARGLLERALEARTPKKTLSVWNLPKSKDDLKPPKKTKDKIRHELEFFEPNALCYVMSASPLALGTDSDGDGLNARFERQIGTHADVADTDGDGLADGLEHFFGTTKELHHLTGLRSSLNPLIRDSDQDGIIDGIEDMNRNGNVDPDETDPRTKDTDRDGLCDGLCITPVRNQKLLLGEDLNLDGKVDADTNGKAKETDPRKADTNGDGVSDFQAYFNCQLGMKQYCLEGQATP